MTTMIERVARAIELCWHRGTHDSESIAHAAIAAMREPTEDVKAAGRKVSMPCLAVWQAMIDAALEEK